MNYFGIKPNQLFEWGMNATIFPADEKVEVEWESLKKRITNNEEVTIRGYGRDAHGTKLYLDFYSFVFDNQHVKKDPSNNNIPQRNIRKLTGLERNKDIYNYQVSHIWGRTKNIFLFEAPWNVCYTPKIIDPLTGHETKGDLPAEFQEQFRRYAQKKYEKYIDDYNSLISSYDIPAKLKEFCKREKISDDRFINDASSELSQIQLL